jgi:GNAT superfamily N-acetyltransferase
MITIRNYKLSDVYDVAKLVQKTYKQFNAAGENAEAVQWYIDIFDTKKKLEDIKKMFANGAVTLVAVENDKIIGFLWGRKDRIINLYIDGRYHGKGIGKKLVERYEQKVRELGTEVIKIRSSLFAVPFYEKMGYRKSTGIRPFHGLRVQPMKKILK